MTTWAELTREPLLSAVRLSGVAVGLWGTYLTAPDAWREVVVRPAKKGRALAREGVAALGRLTARLVVSLRRLLGLPVVHQMAGTVNIKATVTGDGVVVAAEEEASAWADEITGQIEILRARTVQLAKDVRELGIEQARGIDELRVALSATAAEHAAALDALRTEQRRKERALLDLNVRALPLIGVSFLLLGLPDALVKWQPVAIALLLIALVLVLGIGLGRANDQS